MKVSNRIKASVLAMSAAFASMSAIAAPTPAELFKVPPSAVYQVIQGKPLAEVLQQVAQRSGIQFKINAEVKGRLVTHTLAANDWASAIKTLLDGYNYSMIQDGKSIKTVIISGYNGSGSVAQTAVASIPAENLMVISPAIAALPEKYKDFPAGAVTPINLPIAAIMAMTDGDTAQLDLPIGQFTTTHDTTLADGFGNKTWVGHLTNEGLGYRMMVSQGDAGIMGHVITPEGTFNVESDKEGLYLVDTRKLKNAGFEGDTAAQPFEAEAAAGLVSSAAATSTTTAPVTPTIAQLQANVATMQANLTKANDALAINKKAANTASALVTSLAGLVAKDPQLLKDATALAQTTNTAYLAELSNLNAKNLLTVNAKKAQDSAQAAYNAAVLSKNKTAIATATTNLNNAKAAFTAANTLSQASLTSSTSKKALADKAALALTALQKDIAARAQNLTAAKAQLVAANDLVAKATATVATAQTALTSAQKALTDAQANANKAPAGSDAVVDVMVEYTTAGMTPDYAKQRIQYLITISNQAYKDSGLPVSLRLVYAEPTTYAESTTNSAALDALRTGQGAFATVPANRIKYGADLVVLLRPLRASTQGSCGVAYIGFTGGIANKNLGFGVVGDGASKDTMKVFCDVNTFAHEIGHNFGLVHDREYSSSAGVTPYAYAWGIAGKFGTIMSYKSPTIMLFSTPNLATQCAGTPCGYAETDAAKSSDQVKAAKTTVGQITAYLPTVATVATIK
ncbi:MAG: reprolysin-like metallopeptidase [Methylococcales bacterium]